MRWLRVAMLALATGLTTGAVTTFAQSQVGFGECPIGQIGVVVAWPDGSLTPACAGAARPSAEVPEVPEVVGLVVRWSDGSQETIQVARPPTATTGTAPPRCAVKGGT